MSSLNYKNTFLFKKKILIISFLLFFSCKNTNENILVIPNFSWPLYLEKLPSIPGISSTFGESRLDHFHNGLDIVAKIGTPVNALTSGNILFSYNEKDEFDQNERGVGNYIFLDHGSGYYSSYYHLEEKNLKRSGFVYSSDILGLIGNTGRSSGVHLHFSIYKNYGKTIINPLKLLPEIKDNLAPTFGSLIIITPDSLTKLFYKKENEEHIENLSVEKKLNKKYKYKKLLSSKIQKEQTIRLTQNFPIYLELFDQGLEKESHRGVYYLDWQINDEPKLSNQFDQLDYKNGQWYLGARDFTKVYYEKYLLLGMPNLMDGKNIITVNAADFHSNSIKVVYEFKVNKEY